MSHPIHLHGHVFQIVGIGDRRFQGAVVATNPALVFFGAQRPGEAAKLQDAFRLSPQQRAYLEGGNRGDFLLAAGADRLAVRVKAPPWQEEVMRLARSPSRPPS